MFGASESFSATAPAARPFGSGLHKQAKHVEAVFLGERGQSRDGVYLFHISTNMELMSKCQAPNCRRAGLSVDWHSSILKRIRVFSLLASVLRRKSAVHKCRGSDLAEYSGKLSPKQIADGMNAANANAKRLMNDAKILLEKGSIPSAAALAILSIEETGKLSLLRGTRCRARRKEDLGALETVSTSRC